MHQHWRFHKTGVSPVLMHQRYHSLALNHSRRPGRVLRSSTTVVVHGSLSRSSPGLVSNSPGLVRNSPGSVTATRERAAHTTQVPVTAGLQPAGLHTGNSPTEKLFLYLTAPQVQILFLNLWVYQSQKFPIHCKSYCPSPTMKTPILTKWGLLIMSGIRGNYAIFLCFSHLLFFFLNLVREKHCSSTQYHVQNCPAAHLLWHLSNMKAMDLTEMKKLIHRALVLWDLQHGTDGQCRPAVAKTCDAECSDMCVLESQP